MQYKQDDPPIMRPTLEEVARQAIETLSSEFEFFQAKPHSSERSAALAAWLNAKAELRKMAEAFLAPPALFDTQD